GWHDDNPAYGRFFTSMHLPDASADQIRAYDDLLRQTTSPANAIAMMRSFHRADVRDSCPESAVRPLCCIHVATLSFHSSGAVRLRHRYREHGWSRSTAATTSSWTQSQHGSNLSGRSQSFWRCPAPPTRTCCRWMSSRPANGKCWTSLRRGWTTTRLPRGW